MADRQISELVEAVAIEDNDLLVLQQGETAKKAKGKTVKDWVYNESVENFVIVSDTEPTTERNHIWVDPSEEDVVIPTMDDLQGLTAEDISYDGSATHTSGSVGKAISDLGSDIDDLDAGDVAYNSGTTYASGSVGAELATQSEKMVTKDGVGQVDEENTTFFTRPENLFDPKTVVLNKKLDTDGTLYDLTGYASSDYINVTGLTGLKFLFDATPRAATAYFFFYDDDKTPIGQRDVQTTATVPSGATFIRVTIAATQVSSFMVVRSDLSPTAYIEHKYSFNYSAKVTIYPTDDVIQKLLDNAGADIYFESGNYDIIQIYKDKYGNDYFDNYAGYSTSNPADRGLPVLRGTKLSFSQGAYFSAIYEGENSSVWKNFSAFALESNVVLDGLILNTKDIRNPIHDDFDNYKSGTTIIKNCYITGNSLVIAGGFGQHEDIILENNYFATTRNGNYDISYHNSSLTNAQSRITIKDNYFGKGIRLSYYGTTELITNAYISNNSMAYDVTLEAETAGSTTENMAVTKWNNVIRT